MEDLLYLVSKAVKQNIDWSGIEAALSSVVIPMSRTQQNPAFHAEGDVWTHTKMVCEELVKLGSFRNLTEDEQQIVFLAALLHDIGKIPTTRWEDGKWTSPNHILLGSKMARQFLWLDMGLCGTLDKMEFRETVCNLIRYHSFPPHAIDDPDGKRKLIAIAANGELCPLFSIELLCILCEADALGRVCMDEHDRIHMVEQVQLCREFAFSLHFPHGPFLFPSDHTKFSYLSGRNIPPEMEFYDDTWGEVYLLSGLPGTGKDTWIKNITLPMISLDEIRKEMKISPTDNQSKVLEIARERAREFLRKKQPFVWNATNITPMTRQKQVELFTAYSASVHIVYLETTWDDQVRRNAGRADAVPENAICDMLEKLVPPQRWEAAAVEWHCI